MPAARRLYGRQRADQSQGIAVQKAVGKIPGTADYALQFGAYLVYDLSAGHYLSGQRRIGFESGEESAALSIFGMLEGSFRGRGSSMLPAGGPRKFRGFADVAPSGR